MLTPAPLPKCAAEDYVPDILQDFPTRMILDALPFDTYLLAPTPPGGVFCLGGPMKVSDCAYLGLLFLAAITLFTGQDPSAYLAGVLVVLALKK